MRKLYSSRNREAAALRILEQALVEWGGGFNWVCTGQMWFSAGNCWEQQGMGVGTSQLVEKIKMLVTCAFNPLKEVSGLLLLSLRWEWESVVCLCGF